jgi:F-type H+-transporting ATPase subunit delta
MQNLRMYKIYAKSFTNYALAEKLLDHVLEDLNKLSDFFKANKSLERAICSKVINHEILKKIFIESGVNRLSIELIMILIKQGLFGALHQVTSQMNKLYDESKGITHAILLTPHDLSEKQFHDTVTHLETKFDKKFKTEHIKESSLIAGMIFKFDSMMYDTSLLNAMKKLQKINNIQG